MGWRRSGRRSSRPCRPRPAPSSSARPDAARSGRAMAATRAATIAMFQPEMATTWVRPAAAKASLISGAIEARTPSRIPAPSAASGSGTIAFSPPSSAARAPASIAAGPAAPPTTSANRGRPMAPTPCRARYSRYAKPSKSSGSSAVGANPETIAAAGVDAAWHPHQHPIGERDRAAVGGDQQFAEDELDPILARPRIVDHPADELVLLAIHQDRDRRPRRPAATGPPRPGATRPRRRSRGSHRPAAGRLRASTSGR